MSRNSPSAQNADQAQRLTLLDVTHPLSPEPRIHYIYHSFEVPEGARKVGLIFSFHKERLAQLFLSLYSPRGYRGTRMNPGAKGDITLELWSAPDDASEGGMTGAIDAGQWTAQIDIERLKENTEYRLQAYAELGPAKQMEPWTFPENHVVNPAEGWYQGELHAHSTESDAKYPVSTVVNAAMDTGLDFLAMTEHFTVSQWRKLAPLVNDRIALLRSCELTSHQGHANLHGISEWVDPYVDRDDRNMNQVAEEVHQQGGLFCINHPFSGDLGWRAHDFDWDLADLMEIYHNLEGCNNAFQAILWDHHLRLGRRLIGVGGIDSHDPFEGTHRLGQLVTWIYAPELSEHGIIEGLRNGRVYMSKGPELRFTAEDAAGNQAEMWQSLALGNGPYTFTVRVKTEEPLRLFVFKNGYPFDTYIADDASGEWQTLTFQDKLVEPTYFRLELHAKVKNETYPGIDWRDYETMRVISNPIMVGR